MNTPTTSVQPYLMFNGRCEEALEFYRQALGAKVERLVRYSEMPEAPAPGMENKVMHTAFRIGESVILASDGCGDETGFSGFSLSLTLPTEEEVNRAFAALAEGGKVKMPLGKTFWTSRFGMVIDRFGLGWMIGVAA